MVVAVAVACTMINDNENDLKLSRVDKKKVTSNTTGWDTKRKAATHRRKLRMAGDPWGLVICCATNSDIVISPTDKSSITHRKGGSVSCSSPRSGCNPSHWGSRKRRDCVWRCPGWSGLESYNRKHCAATRRTCASSGKASPPDFKSHDAGHWMGYEMETDNMWNGMRKGSWANGNLKANMNTGH